jgi:hypothetical protein
MQPSIVRLGPLALFIEQRLGLAQHGLDRYAQRALMAEGTHSMPTGPACDRMMQDPMQALVVGRPALDVGARAHHDARRAASRGDMRNPGVIADQERGRFD